MDWNAIFEDQIHTVAWKISRRRVRAGHKVTTKGRDGYLRVGYGNKIYAVHRVLWEMRNGPIPAGAQIDHINGVRDDNSPKNLRLCTPSQNAYNAKKRANTLTSVKGVSYCSRRKKYLGQIYSKGVREHQYFLSLSAAENWVRERRAALHGEFTRHA